MTSVGWLHLSDLHGVLNPATPAEPLRDDLLRVAETVGSIDLVLVTGDLSMRGWAEEFERAEAGLNQVMRVLKSAGSNPQLLVVPGNHDLVRASEPSPSALRALRRWFDEPGHADEFWADVDSPARRMIARAFDPFERWWRRLSQDTVGLHHGLLPGDFTFTLEKEGVRVGIAGLNSAFLQVTGDDYLGRLALDARQLHVAARGDVPGWVAQHDAALLLTHHPARWLASFAKAHYEAEVNPLGRFCAHLTGHAHDDAGVDLAGRSVEVRSRSFFGAQGWQSRLGNVEFRDMGYCAGRLDLSNPEQMTLEVFEREWSGRAFSPKKPASAELPSIARLPRQPTNAPHALERAVLREALAATYPSTEDALRLATKARLARVPRELEKTAAIDAWQRLICLAEAQDRLSALTEVAKREHASNQVLADACESFTRATSSRPKTVEPPRATLEQVGDELRAELETMEPAALDSTIALAELKATFGPRATPSIRASTAVQEAEQGGAVGVAKLLGAAALVAGPVVLGSNSVATTLLPLIAGLLSAATLSTSLSGRLLATDRKRTTRVPTKSSLAKLLTRMFHDERDFDGFVLDKFVGIYRRFARGMSREQRIKLLLEAADPADIVAKLKRTNPVQFSDHQRVLDYEEISERPPRRLSAR
ncbi:MAG: metallophosphoesterase [Polyangiaceae bacterium]